MEIASKSQAENGTDNNTIMTPLRVKQAINASGGGTPLPSNIAYTDRNNNFSTPQTVTSSVDVTPSSNYGFYKIGGVPIVQYNSSQHNTVVYGAPYDAGVTDGAVYIRPDAVHGYGDVVVTPASTSVDKNLIVGGDTYEWGGHYIGNGNDLTLSPQGPTDAPPTNDTGDIVFNQWRDEGGGAYYEIEKARIWMDNTLNNLNCLPIFRSYDASGNQLCWGRMLINSPIELTNENILELEPGFYFKQGSTGWTENGWHQNTWHATLVVLGYGSGTGYGWRTLICFDNSSNELWMRNQQWDTWASWKKIA